MEREGGGGGGDPNALENMLYRVRKGISKGVFSISEEGHCHAPNLHWKGVREQENVKEREWQSEQERERERERERETEREEHSNRATQWQNNTIRKGVGFK